MGEELRVDNSLKYVIRVGKINFGALYKFGGIAGHNGARSDWALNLGYDEGPFGLQAAYQRMTDALSGKADTRLATISSGAGTPGNTLPAGYPNTVTSVLAITNQNVIGYILAAKYHLPDGNIKAGFKHYVLGKPSDPFGALNVTQLYGIPIDQNSVTSVGADRVFRVCFLGGDYNIRPKLNFAVGYYHVEQDGSADLVYNRGSGVASVGQAAGSQRYYSALLDYNLGGRTDTYVGITLQSLGGAAFQPADYASNRVLALGVRHRF